MRVGGLAQPSPAHPTALGPLTCRLPCTTSGSPALPGQSPGAVRSSSTLRDRVQGGMSFGVTGAFLGFSSGVPIVSF